MNTKIEPKKYAILYYSDGKVDIVVPKYGTHFVLEELQKYVDGKIEAIYLPSGDIMICNEEGRIKTPPLKRNGLATKIWHAEFPKDLYSHNVTEFIVGNVVVCDAHMIK